MSYNSALYSTIGTSDAFYTLNYYGINHVTNPGNNFLTITSTVNNITINSNILAAGGTKATPLDGGHALYISNINVVGNLYIYGNLLGGGGAGSNGRGASNGGNGGAGGGGGGGQGLTTTTTPGGGDGGSIINTNTNGLNGVSSNATSGSGGGGGGGGPGGIGGNGGDYTGSGTKVISFTNGTAGSNWNGGNGGLGAYSTAGYNGGGGGYGGNDAVGGQGGGGGGGGGYASGQGGNGGYSVFNAGGILGNLYNAQGSNTLGPLFYGGTLPRKYIIVVSNSSTYGKLYNIGWGQVLPVYDMQIDICFNSLSESNYSNFTSTILCRGVLVGKYFKASYNNYKSITLSSTNYTFFWSIVPSFNPYENISGTNYNSFDLVINPTSTSVYNPGTGIITASALSLTGYLNSYYPTTPGGDFSVISGSSTYVVFKNSQTIFFTGSGNIDYIIIGGGGAGGNNHGGGGGAGSIENGTFAFTAGTLYSIVIGSGGTTVARISSSKGGNSSAFGVTAYGGGNGGGDLNGPATIGGSGGGGAGYKFSGPYVSTLTNVGAVPDSGSGSNVQAGGSGGALTGSGGGGGGGSGGGGINANGNSGGAGGIGKDIEQIFSGMIPAISYLMPTDWQSATTAESARNIAGGGGGGSWGDGGTTTKAAGGTGGGGTGGLNNNSSLSNNGYVAPTNGINYTGSGGGGGGSGSQTGAPGGHGLVVIRYTTSSGIAVYTPQPYINSIATTNTNTITSSTFSNNSVGVNTAYGIASGIGFTINSDQRIKRNIIPLSSSESLQIVRSLKPCTFQYVDFFKGTVSKYGYLAQEVEAVLPNIVKKSPAFLPNFFVMVKFDIEKRNKIILDQKNTESLAIGTKVRFYDIDNQIHDRDILEIVDTITFTITEPLFTQSETLFLYGQMVDDFRSIDTDQIHTVLLSALKECDDEIENGEKEIEELETEIEHFQKNVNFNDI